MKQKAVFLSLLLVSLWVTIVSAQEETSLSLSLRRDFGSAFGGRIQGTFSFRISGPENLVRVVFLIDGENIGEDNASPFRLQFRTDSYEPGVHTMSAIGYTADGQELQSNKIQRDFMSGETSTKVTTTLVIVLVVLVVGGRIVASRIANRGAGKEGSPSISGPLGGTICPNCKRPYAIHLWSIRLVVVRLDRCPHCGKWRFVRRASPQELETAAELLVQDESTPATLASTKTEEDKLRQQLEDSRYDEHS